MKMSILGLLLLTMAISTACEGGDPTSKETAKRTALNITYSKDDRTGLCFGSITSTSYSSYKVVSITDVPCEKVKDFLVK